ncbi:MAG: hypothetical protein V3V67_13160 [Myxococcota bacterium]
MPKQRPDSLSGQELRDVFVKAGYTVWANELWAWFLHKPGANPLIVLKVEQYDWNAVHHLRRAAGLAPDDFDDLID